MSERHATQQSIYVAAGACRKPFIDNLRGCCSDGPESIRFNVQKVVVPCTQREAALRDLDNMNINHASPFPGIDGYAYPLKARLRFETAHGPADACWRRSAYVSPVPDGPDGSRSKSSG